MDGESLWSTGYSDESFDDSIFVDSTKFLQDLLTVGELNRTGEVFERRHLGKCCAAKGGFARRLSREGLFVMRLREKRQECALEAKDSSKTLVITPIDASVKLRTSNGMQQNLNVVRERS